MNRAWSETELDRLYPATDGVEMGESSEHIDLLTLLYDNFRDYFRDQTVAVHADLFWYPVEGRPEIRRAPDLMIILNCPHLERKSYRQWLEGNKPATVVIEILSESNDPEEMKQRRAWYRRYGVQEYYIYDPDRHELTGRERMNEKLELIAGIEAWTSPRLGIRFDWTPQWLNIYYPDGRRFLSTIELTKQAEAVQMSLRAERERADLEKQRADQAEAENLRLVELLRQAGIEP